MDWYLRVWKKYAEFDGRARRTEYWMFTLFNFLAILALAIPGAIGVEIREDYGALLFIPICLYFLAAIIPSLAVSVRRLHDTGKSGWWLLLFAVLNVLPVIGFISGIVQIVMLCQDSDSETNEYGRNPKAYKQAGMSGGNMGYLSMEPAAQSQLIATESQTHQTPTDF